eukprot:12868429-Prorocentrum_lima.AAC.1
MNKTIGISWYNAPMQTGYGYLHDFHMQWMQNKKVGVGQQNKKPRLTLVRKELVSGCLTKEKHWVINVTILVTDNNRYLAISVAASANGDQTWSKICLT